MNWKLFAHRLAMQYALTLVCVLYYFGITHQREDIPVVLVLCALVYSYLVTAWALPDRE